MIEKHYYEMLKVISKIKDIDAGIWKLEKSYDRINMIKSVLLECFYDGVEHGRARERIEVHQSECDHEFEVIHKSGCYKEYICHKCDFTKSEDTGD